MRRILRLLGYLIGAAAVAAAAAVVLVVFMPREQVAALVSREVERSTGRPLVIEGGLEASIWPVLGVATGPVRLGNAEWGTAPDLVRAEAVEIGVELVALLSGDLKVRRLRLVKPVIELEIAADGRRNWEFTPAGTGTAVPGGGGTGAARQAPRGVALPAAEIVDGRISLHDARDGRSVEVEALDLSAALEALDEPVTLSAEGVVQGRRIALEARLATPADLMAGREITLEARLSGEHGVASFDGHVAGMDATLPRIAGTYALDLPDPAGLAALVGVPLDPGLAALGPVAVEGMAQTDATAMRATAKGRMTWRQRAVAVDLSLASEDVTASEPSAVVTLVAESEGLGRVVYEGPVALAEDRPTLDGRFEVALAAPAAALAWASGGAPEPGLAPLGAMTAAAQVRLVPAGLELDGGGTAEWRGRSVRLDVAAEGGADWREGGPLTLQLAAQAPGLLEASAEGRARLGATAGFTGPVSASTPDLRGLIAWASGTAPETPPGTMGPARLAGRVEIGPDRVAVSELDAALDGTEARGSAEIALATTPPRLTASLTAGDLDLTPVLGGPGEGAGGAGSGSGGTSVGGWSSEPFDLSGLGALDAEVTVDAASIRAGDLRTGRAQLQATLSGGRLDLEIRRLDLYGGQVAGRVDLGGRETARLATDLDIASVELHPLLTALGVSDRLEGRGALRLRLDGQGRSMAELMRSLSGDGALDLQDGAVLGVNLAAIAQNLTGRTTAERTDFSSVTGSFAIEKGVLRNSDFAFLGPLLRVTGVGSVDLGAQRQDFTLTPRAVATLLGQGGPLQAAGLSIFPIRITGSWSNPRIAPDLGAAVGRIMRSPVDAATGLQEVVTGAASLPGAVIGTLTGRGAEAPTEGGSSATGPIGGLLGTLTGRGGTTTPAPDAGTTTGAGGEASAPPAPRDPVSGLLGGLLGTLDPSRRNAPADATPAPAPADPSVEARAVPEAVPEPQPEPAPVAEDGQGGALAPGAAPMSAPRRTAGAAKPPAPLPDAPAADGTVERMPPPTEPAPSPDAGQPARPRIEEEAVRTLDNLLRSLGKN
ncbi:AsmA family protein [Limibaculum sp. FT325]|uniref:AsmA family protein n=1 Tax=Thermohalobaculum sediminis TaxID=2939436 RepID=UPI0020C0A9B1|nr:AsmA family protein [Limibaculum sediminis]MCL5777977.1 AsmA family protein [Limibaculum sediminis]